jgi:hypothetical protein
MNKIVRSRSAIQWRIKRSDVWSNLQSLQRFCLPPLGGGQPSFLRLQYLNRVRMRVIFPATCHQQVV